MDSDGLCRIDSDISQEPPEARDDRDLESKHREFPVYPLNQSWVVSAPLLDFAPLNDDPEHVLSSG